MVDPPGSLDRSHGVSVVLTTVPDAQVGESLVRTLVEEQLIACGNLVPGLVSIYRWEGSVAREPEVLVVMKAGSTGLDPLFERLAGLHPYSVPELIALPVEAVSRAYASWVIESVKGSS
jgi:periplasmic divalent cation tolerance protein